MIVEPFANDKVEDNLNPVGRVYYSASTMICTPASRSQEVGRAWRGPAVDFVFVDGDHSPEGCREDWEAWHPHVRPGGAIAWMKRRR